MKAVLRVFLVICFANFEVTTRAYKINKFEVTWEEAKELCQRNGSILAVVDSQQKINELSDKLSFLGYQSAKHKFWVGLRTNASLGHFVWSTGEIAQASFINSAGINSGHIQSGQERCYLFKNEKSSSSCFQQRQCTHKHYFICESSSFTELLSNLSTSNNRVTTSSMIGVESLTVTSKKSTVTLATGIQGRRSSSSLAEESSTTTSQLTSATSSRSTTTSVIHFFSTTSASMSLQTSINLDKRQNTGTSVISHNTASRTLNGHSIATTTTSSPSSILADAGVKDREQLENPISAFINFVESLNPKDSQALELLTEKYGDLAISLKANAGKDIEDNVIESVQAIEDFAFKYAVLNLNASKNQERKKNQHIDTVVFNALYMDLHEYVARSNPRKSIIDSRILGTSIKPSQRTVFEENVTIVLQTFSENHVNAEQKCAFWKWNHSHPENGVWSSEGCRLLDAQENFTVCMCNHLTNFAILMNIKKQTVPQKHELPLSYITYIGLGLSLLGETITIMTYLLLLWSKHNQQSQVHINLVTTLAMAQVFFLAGIKSTQDQVLCITVAALIHYFYLSSFCWMLIEGVMLYLLIIEVYNVAFKLRYCYLFAYGFPALVVTATLLTAHLTEGDGIYQYKSSKWCWLSGENHYIWSFVAPVILVTCVNVVVFCAVVKEMLSMTSVKSTGLNALKTTIKACIVLFPLLGITWLFGLLSFSQAGVATQYLFTIFNSIQGLLIFLLHCVRNSEVRSAWKEKLQFLKKRIWILFGIQNSSPSNTSVVRSSRPERSEMELQRKTNKISPVEG